MPLRLDNKPPQSTEFAGACCLDQMYYLLGNGLHCFAARSRPILWLVLCFENLKRVILLRWQKLELRLVLCSIDYIPHLHDQFQILSQNT